jgi:hypothetical protein
VRLLFDAAFEVTDGPGADAGRGGQLLMRQADPPPVTDKQVGKRGFRIKWHRIKPYVS